MRGAGITCLPVPVLGVRAARESNEGRMADALAHSGDEGRDKLR